MYGDPQTWNALMGHLADITITFLGAAGRRVDAVQLVRLMAGQLSPPTTGTTSP